MDVGYARFYGADDNVRNGTRPKTVISPTTGPVTIQVPRDRDGTFTPVIVPKRHRRLTGVDEIVLSLYAHGLTTGEISATLPWPMRPPLAAARGGSLPAETAFAHPVRSTANPAAAATLRVMVG